MSSSFVWVVAAQLVLASTAYAQAGEADSDTDAPTNDVENAGSPFFIPSPTQYPPPTPPEGPRSGGFIAALGMRARVATLVGRTGSGNALDALVYLGGRYVGGYLGFSGLDDANGAVMGFSAMRYSSGITVFEGSGMQVSVLLPDVNLEAQLYLLPGEGQGGFMLSTDGFGVRWSMCLAGVALHASLKGPVLGVGALGLFRPSLYPFVSYGLAFEAGIAP